MQQALDYVALIAFVVAYFVTRDIFIATAVLLAGVTLQVVVLLLMKKPLNSTVKVTFWASWALGGLTLVLRDQTFIQWKPTIVNWVLALALVGTWLIGKSHLLKKMLGKALILPDAVWTTLTYGWALGFIAMGCANLWVAYNFSMDTWVTFKLVGLMAINLSYVAITLFYLHNKGFLKEENLPSPETGPEADSGTNPETTAETTAETTPATSPETTIEATDAAAANASQTKASQGKRS
jgi:intracellular septation protein